jgi:Family of unknown function (DUF6152)
MGMKKLLLFLSVGFGILIVSGSLLAHHGVAAFDSSKVVSVQGAVTDFQFINPHVIISLDVKNEKGEIEKWGGEAQSAPMLARYGWTKNTLKAGDVIAASGYRSKSGTNYLRLIKITLPDGREMGNL